MNGKSGSVLVSRQTTGHGFLRRDVEFPYTFVYDDRTRYFLFGNTYYALLDSVMNGGGWKDAVDKTRALGMNKIRFTVYRGGLGASEGKADPGALEKPDLEAMNALDNLVRYLGSQEIIADLLMVRRAHVNAMTLEQGKNWMRYLVARYGAFPNVIWCLTNEWEYSDKGKDFWSALGRFVHEEDPMMWRGKYQRGLSVHQQTRYDWQMPGEKWFSHAIIQLGVRNRGKAHRGGDEWKRASNDWRNSFHHGDDWGHFGIAHSWGRNYPVVNDEYGYIGEPRDETEPKTPSGESVRYSREKHRRTIWGIYMAGGFGSAGDKNQYPEGRPYITPSFWRDTSEWDDVSHLIRFFTGKGLEWWKLMPSQNLVSGGDRVYVLAEEGRQYVVYAAAGGTVSIRLASGDYEARRFDPRTGAEAALGTMTGSARIQLPDNQDWVVVLNRRR